MSHDAHPFANGADPEPHWQAQLAVVARALPYPPTPNLAAGLAGARGPVRDRLLGRPPAVSPRLVRGLAWSVAAVVLALAVLLAIPATRASLLEFLQIGSVRIFFVATETPLPAPTVTLAAAGTPAPSATPRPTRTPTPTPLLSVLDIAGQTTFAQAHDRVPFNLRLPAYPPDLGEPDIAFVQDLGGPAAVLVWLAPGDPSQVRLTLHFLTSAAVADKMLDHGGPRTPPSVETTSVNGHPAVWTTGPYVLFTRNGNLKEYRLIEGHVLIWTDGTLSYRLETSMSREDAVRTAESMGQ